MKFLSLFNIIAKSVFKPAATYTSERESKSPITRGHIINDIESCIFCGMCVRKCPADALAVDKTDRTWEINRFRCVVCNACVECCPKKCLSMDTEPSKPKVKRDTEVLKAKAADSSANVLKAKTTDTNNNGDA